jgi:hypothetical protein
MHHQCWRNDLLEHGRGLDRKGHYLMLRIDTTASATTWRVTFRY